jgi:hypothetical protein
MISSAAVVENLIQNFCQHDNLVKYSHVSYHYLQDSLIRLAAKVFGCGFCFLVGRKYLEKQCPLNFIDFKTVPPGLSVISRFGKHILWQAIV